MWKENLKKYDALVDECPRFERKGKTMPYTSANGYMFSLLNKDGEFGIRFSKEVQQEYIQKLNSELFMSYGAVMKGYVRIPEEHFNNTELMIQLLNESFDYVMSLDPK